MIRPSAFLFFVCCSCQQIVDFENWQRTTRGHALAYVADHAVITALEPMPGDSGLGEALARQREHD